MTDNNSAFPGNVEVDGSEISVPIKAADPVAFPGAPAQLYRLVFKQNRAFELHIGNEVLRFENGALIFPLKYTAGIPESIINSDDFLVMKNYFVVKKIGE
jgi:hypothetical protein